MRWTKDAAERLLDARQYALEQRRHAVETLAVAISLLPEIAIGGSRFWVGNLVTLVGLRITDHLRSPSEPVTRRAAEPGPLPSSTLLAAIAEAGRIARDNGRSYATSADLLLGILKQPSLAARRLRRLRAISRVNFTRSLHQVSLNRAGWQMLSPDDYPTHDEAERQFLEQCFGSGPG